jgi:hypothetical protein
MVTDEELLLGMLRCKELGVLPMVRCAGWRAVLPCACCVMRWVVCRAGASGPAAAWHATLPMAVLSMCLGP